MDSEKGPIYATGWPIYQVTEAVRIYGINPMDVDPDDWEEDEEGAEVPYIERRVLVQGAASLTRGGIDEYLRINGHNLREPLIYVGSMRRVETMKDLVRALMVLAREG